MYFRLFSTLIIIAVVSIFFGKSCSNSLYSPNLPPYLLTDSPWADSLIQCMSLDEKIGQLFMVAANGKNTDENYYVMIDSLIENYALGGLIYFQADPNEHNRLVNRYQSKSSIPLMNGMDGEWGLAMRIDSLKPYPWNMTLGAIKNNELLYEMGHQLAQECKTMGIHFNFAPVVDVNSNPFNPIINARSYGEDPINVAYKSTSFMQGIHDAGVLTCAKHFPGHGDTDKDSHKTLPLINHSRERLDSIDLLPFKYLIQQGVGSVMVAHLNIPSLDTTQNRASTLSPYIVDTLLQQELGFRGLVFTDALNMKGVSNFYNSGELEVAAIDAGNDVLLFPKNVPKAFKAIHKAIKDSVLTEDRISKSCHKILKAKEWLGLHKLALLDTLDVLNKVQNNTTDLLIQRLEAAALTVLKNIDDEIPFRELKNKKIAVLSIGDKNSEAFYTQLKRYAYIHKFNSNTDKASDFDKLIISIHKSNISPWKSYEISDYEKELIRMYSKITDVSLVVFANPYSLLDADYLKNIKTLLIAYQNSESMQSIAAQSLFGAIDISGSLPVSLTKEFRKGYGIQVNSLNRLKYTVPEEVGMNRDTLELIDSIVHKAIEIKATPGCQVLVAKDAKVVYNKSFGYHTYDSLNMVDEFDVYDLASITKIVSLLPIIMQKVDVGSFDIDKPISKYLSIEDTCSKAKLSSREILAHHAQLWPWIPFYRKTLMDDGNLNPNIYSSVKKADFKTQVGHALYMNDAYIDTIFKRVMYSKMREEKGYKYSDLGYYILKEIIETQEGNSLKHLINNQVYKELGANYTTYHPIEKFDINSIVPSENDTYFRNQLLRGYVHDPGAAMQNGVGGHAGVFSNANDLAKIMQMYLNGGSYAGKRYINEKTLKEFTSCQYCRKDNRRGIGFDKPVIEEGEGPTCPKASPSSFGHSGFTGTIAWVDPEYDLIYIFLSNRIYPTADNFLLLEENIRTKVQEVIYNAIE